LLQLIKLKEDVLAYLSDGSCQHLITAFWEYLILPMIARPEGTEGHHHILKPENRISHGQTSRQHHSGHSSAKINAIHVFLMPWKLRE
jgi:hypothetical protein